MKLTKEEAVKLHRELWGWLAENPMKHKADWPGFKDKGHIINRCFCCEFTADIKREIDCIKCPLVWPGGRCDSSLFGEWEPAKLPEERSRLAALIRDLPEKKEEKPALKVGDWVKVLNPRQNFPQYQDFFKENNLEQLEKHFVLGITPEKNGIYQIAGIGKHSNDTAYGPIYVLQSKSGRVFLMHNGYTADKVPNPSLELTDPPAPKYQIGDKVVPVSKSVGDSFEAWTKHRKKDYVTVQQLPPNKFGNFYICNGDYFLESDLIPYIEPEVKPEPVKEEPKPAFKVGDRVRVNANLPQTGLFDFVEPMRKHAGQITTVTRIFTNCSAPNGFGYKLDGIGFMWYEDALISALLINQAPENKTETMLSITFTFKGSQTICRIEESGRKFKGSAKCNPGDEWNEQIGKDLSMARAEIKRANHDIRKATGHK